MIKSHPGGLTKTRQPIIIISVVAESRNYLQSLLIITSMSQFSLQCHLRFASKTFDINTLGWINVSNTFGGSRSQPP